MQQVFAVSNHLGVNRGASGGIEYSEDCPICGKHYRVKFFDLAEPVWANAEQISEFPQVGTLATLYVGTDRYPFEVIKDGKTPTLRALSANIVFGSEQDGSAQYVYTPNEQGRTISVRQLRDGYWYVRGTGRRQPVIFGYALRYRDPHF